MPNFTSPTTHRDRLQALYDLSLELAALRDLNEVLNTALQHCLALTESEFGFIGLTTDNHKHLDIVAIHGFHPQGKFFENTHLIPLRPNIFSRTVLENRPTRSDDVTSDPHRVGQPAGHPPVGTFMGVPLRIRQLPIGMIGVANRPAKYQDDHEHLLMTYAAQVAIAIQNAQLNEQLTQAKIDLEHKVAQRTYELNEAKEALAQKAEQLKRLLDETMTVQERERQRISHDLHDGLNQLIVGAMLELKAGRDRLQSSNNGQANLHKVDIALQSVGNILHQVESEIRQIIFDLRPPALDTLGLGPTLRRYAEHYAAHIGSQCYVRIFGTPQRLPPHDEIGIYRILQEALHNIGEHAHAQTINISMHFQPHSFSLEVSDDGCGFDQSVAMQGHDYHFGLISMRERAESLGGKITIQTAPNCGTRVLVCLTHHS